jgi:hypothetical protein
MRLILRLLAAAALALALGGWTKPQQLETAPVHGAALEGDGHGHRVAAWITDTDVRVAMAEKGRDFGPARTLAGTGGRGVDLAVGPRGDALVVWYSATPGYVPETGDGCCTIIRAALLSRSGRITGPVTLTSTASRPPTNTLSVVIGAGSGGRFGVAWSSPDPEWRFARIASIRRGFGALERVPGGGVNRGGLTVAS